MPLPHAFEVTLQHSQVWLDDVLDELRTDDRQLAYAALRAVLHALRDRLPPAEAVDLAAQLPMLLRGLFFEGWGLRDRSDSLRSKKSFLRHVAHGIKRTDVTPEDAVRAVFAMLSRRVASGEIRDVIGALPETFDDLWPASADAVG
jgi:uncharacterized protein (DUF2267 family)